MSRTSDIYHERYRASIDERRGRPGRAMSGSSYNFSSMLYDPDRYKPASTKWREFGQKSLFNLVLSGFVDAELARRHGFFRKVQSMRRLTLRMLEEQYYTSPENMLDALKMYPYDESVMKQYRQVSLEGILFNGPDKDNHKIKWFNSILLEYALQNTGQEINSHFLNKSHDYAIDIFGGLDKWLELMPAISQRYSVRPAFYNTERPDEQTAPKFGLGVLLMGNLQKVKGKVDEYIAQCVVLEHVKSYRQKQKEEEKLLDESMAKTVVDRFIEGYKETPSQVS